MTGGTRSTTGISRAFVCAALGHKAHVVFSDAFSDETPLWKPDEVDEIQTVTTEEAKGMARRLAREEAIFAGTSSGANVVAALRLAQRLGAQATVATIIVDSGLRYLSTDVFRSSGAVKEGAACRESTCDGC